MNVYEIVSSSSRMLESSYFAKLDAVQDKGVGGVRHPHTLNLGK